MTPAITPRCSSSASAVCAGLGRAAENRDQPSAERAQ
jgi:hypothetical protein